MSATALSTFRPEHPAAGATGCAGWSASRRSVGGTGLKTGSPVAPCFRPRRPESLTTVRDLGALFVPARTPGPLRGHGPAMEPTLTMDPTSRFTTLVQGSEPTIRLDHVALLVSARANPGLDIGRSIEQLDEIAARCADHSLEGVMRHLFALEKFTGNRDDYYDPRNSFLNEVIDRRLGIPITLGIV